ncbi:EXS family-domain-containing protein [Crepidotus variabilis]|uniref:EXS family-domain-containing protein n=1 Tax=Crepidotus variabilis TaxID=179855 RepID=A0A9P6JQH8_9AGAR|nr:EXS family-domain-containing protein [Crepidotus variabilis]
MSTPQDEEVFKNLSFPLPYRVLFLIGLGIFGWAANLHGLDILGVDAVGAMDLRADAQTSKSVMPVHHANVFNHTKAVVLYRAAYRLCWSYAAYIFTSWIVFRLITHGDRSLVDQYGFIPGVTALAAVYLIFCPHDILFKAERDKFTAAIKRCLFPGTGPIYFSDVILADIATSFAKVFGDIWQSLWMVKPGNSILKPPVHDNWLRWVMPTMMSIPFLIRFRQCMVEYTSPANESRKPLYNALKYATSFPVIFLSAAQRLVVADLVKERGNGVVGEPWHGEHPLFRMWLMAGIVNSLYSFWWDVTNDWGMDLFRFGPSQNHDRLPPKPLILARLHSGSSTPLLDHRDSLASPPAEHQQLGYIPTKHNHRQSCHGLRAVLHYPRAIYPVLIFLNLLLRMTWSVKLSTHVQSPRDGSFAFFWLEIAELVRRWLWVFLRVEWEVVKMGDIPPPRTVLFQAEDRSDDGDFEMLPTSPDIISKKSEYD